MKKLITTLLLSASAIIGFGQSMALLYDGHNVSNTIVDVYVAPGTTDYREILVSNSLETSLDTVLVKRNIYSMAASDSTQFCWAGSCYDWGSPLSGHYLSIPAGDTVDYLHYGFHAIFVTGPTATTRLVHYRFYNKNTTDSTGVTIRYNYSTVGIDEVSKTANIISNAYPNPASSSISIKYDINDLSQKGRIIFYDVLGKAVKEVVLNDKQGTVNIGISDLNTGIYFYKFLVDEKEISTKKLIISSK